MGSAGSFTVRTDHLPKYEVPRRLIRKAYGGECLADRPLGLNKRKVSFT
jgi:hypothetical protein